MVDKVKVINFLQDFGCANLKQLQVLFGDKESNFRNILNDNLVSRKGDVFVHNTQSIDSNMLVAIDLVCLFKPKIKSYFVGDDPANITFLTKDNLLYHIIVADEKNKEGIIKMLNSKTSKIPEADKLILAFPDTNEIDNIKCTIPFMYIKYPELEVIESKCLIV